jgi:hypothetical protein
VSRVLLVAVLLTALPVAILVARAPAGPAPIEPVEITAATAPTAPPPIEVLRRWDRQRAAAWASGDPGRLSALYTPRSEAGRRDRAMLRAWAARGLVVRDLQTQLLSVRQLSRTRSTWALLVTDRLAGGVAVGRGTVRPLPRDEPTTRTVRLRLVDGRWRVSAVAPLQSGF